MTEIDSIDGVEWDQSALEAALTAERALLAEVPIGHEIAAGTIRAMEERLNVFLPYIGERCLLSGFCTVVETKHTTIENKAFVELAEVYSEGFIVKRLKKNHDYYWGIGMLFIDKEGGFTQASKQYVLNIDNPHYGIVPKEEVTTAVPEIGMVMSKHSDLLAGIVQTDDFLSLPADAQKRIIDKYIILAAADCQQVAGPLEKRGVVLAASQAYVRDLTEGKFLPSPINISELLPLPGWVEKVEFLDEERLRSGQPVRSTSELTGSVASMCLVMSLSHDAAQYINSSRQLDRQLVDGDVIAVPFSGQWVEVHPDEDAQDFLRAAAE